MATQKSKMNLDNEVDKRFSNLVILVLILNWSRMKYN